MGIALGMAEQNRNMFDFVYLIIIIPNSIVNIFCKKFFKIKKKETIKRDVIRLYEQQYIIKADRIKNNFNNIYY